MSINQANLNIPPCSICLEDVFYCQTLASCANKTISHVFHRTCANNWAKNFKATQEVTCPECRNYHLIDVVGSKEAPASTSEGEQLFIVIRAQVRINLETYEILLNTLLAQRTAARAEQELVTPPGITGIALGFCSGLAFFRQLTITALALAAIKLGKENEKALLSGPAVLSMIALACGIAALAKDLLTERNLFKKPDLVKRAFLTGLQVSTAFTVIFTATAIFASLFTPQRN